MFSTEGCRSNVSGNYHTLLFQVSLEALPYYQSDLQ
jgi:hypothetical protein